MRRVIMATISVSPTTAVTQLVVGVEQDEVDLSCLQGGLYRLKGEGEKDVLQPIFVDREHEIPTLLFRC